MPPTRTTAPSQPTATLIPGVEIADPILVKQVSTNQAQVGDQIEYILTVTNAGTIAAQNVVVSDPLPSFVTLINATTTKGVISVAGTTVTITIGEVAPGEVVTIRIRVRVVSPAAPPANVNTASLTTSSSTNVINNDTSTVIVQVPQPVATSVPATSVPATAVPTRLPATTIPATAVPTRVPATNVPATAVPPTVTPRQPTATPRRATAIPQPPGGGGPIGLPDTGVVASSPLPWLVGMGTLLALAGIGLASRRRR